MYILAFDLGTGGNKASLYDAEGNCLSRHFEAYETFFPHACWHEQRPEQWWEAVIKSTRALIQKSGVDSTLIKYIAMSGHSMSVVPIDANGKLLRDSVPIWSDTRAKKQAAEFFQKIKYDEWYMTTGNGFSRECYAVFKMMWYRDNEPLLYENTYRVLGTKDYINFRLTGKLLTDNSYASGSGVYDLKKRTYQNEYMKASGLRACLFPDIVPSHAIVGKILPAVADALQLPRDLRVMAGGGDNSCMALGAGNLKPGRVYLSLGTSAWIAVSSEQPVVDSNIKPFVFDHVVPGLYTSATSIFSAGNSLSWASEILRGYRDQAALQNQSPYALMDIDAVTSPIGANGLLFNPSLAGAPASYDAPGVRGALLGLQLHHTTADIVRAVLEGIAMDLCLMHRKLEAICDIDREIVIVGGGSKSRFWRQLFADIFDRTFVRISTDQDAASLGAAAVAAVGAGIWKDYSYIDNVIKRLESIAPIPENARRYEALISRYARIIPQLSQIGGIMEGM
jgi:xylulokinase